VRRSRSDIRYISLSLIDFYGEEFDFFNMERELHYLWRWLEQWQPGDRLPWAFDRYLSQAEVRKLVAALEADLRRRQDRYLSKHGYLPVVVP
jgi:hypothetical protein